MKTSADDFYNFKTHCQKYIEKFGLKDWKIYYHHKRLDVSFAEIQINITGSVADIYLNTELNSRDYKHFNPMDLAKHEILHLLLQRYRSLAVGRFVPEWAIGEEEHRIVRILEKLL